MATLLGVSHSKPSLKAPTGSCDCHTHVFGPVARFPYSAQRTYTPGDASIEALDALHRHLGIDRVVIVHPSPYGADNRVSIDAIARFGTKRARGVAVIDPGIGEPELRALDAAGVCGARVNLETAGVADPANAWGRIEATAARIAPHGWHLQIFARLGVIAALGDKLATLPVQLVIDHFGRPDTALGIEQPGFAVLRRLVGSGKTYVKLSASYRISNYPDHADATPIAQALIADNPERILWGTDWPHPGGATRAPDKRDEIEPFLPIDDGAALDRLVHWAGTGERLQRILVENPARLYRFD